MILLQNKNYEILMKAIIDVSHRGNRPIYVNQLSKIKVV